ncbi:MAG: XRE family transcriptional regulator [Flavipsychrobacter sp.]|nr:XRE family transcriptional regulator [Flavipsychrobacter sp.]
MEKKIHHGKNIARFRQMLGMKQDLLASIMGDDWTQIKISRLEAKEEIEEGILDEVSKAMKIPVEAIKNFDEESALSIVTNTFTSQDTSTLNANPYCTFNPLDKVVELFERLLASEKEKVELLKQIIEKNKK